MLFKKKYIQRKRYYYYDTYRTWRQAYNVGRYYKRKEHNPYYIDKTTNALNQTVYKLYFRKRARL